MPRVATGEVELCFETFGVGEPLVLIMGIGAQMVHWDDAFCVELSRRGFEVIRFDNRDVGHSTRLDRLGTPALRTMMMRYALGASIDPPYRLEDMAGDVSGLISALGHESAHVVGASMGGMIAQALAIAHPAQVRSLTSIMSHCGDRWSAVPTARGFRALLRPAPRTPAEAEVSLVEFVSVVGSPKFPLDEAGIRRRARLAFERGLSPAGFLRQFAAVLAASDRREGLGALDVPALVVHGTEDPLVRTRGGVRTAGALRGSELLLIDDMGHDLHPRVWQEVFDAIGRTTARARRSP